jgi:hypothetical protein
MLDSKHLSYRQIQQLAMQLGLKGNGKRNEIVQRLRTWHQEKTNFAMVEVKSTFRKNLPRKPKQLIFGAGGCSDETAI